MMRLAQTAARGAIISIIVDIITLIRICIRYCRNAVNWPICMSPASIRMPPNHITPTLPMFITNMTNGKSTANKVPMVNASRMMSPLAWSKRLRSRGSRVNALITRMPVICSRTTRLMVSILTWLSWKSGVIRQISTPITEPSATTATRISHDSTRSSRNAMKTPPIMVIGAEIIMVQVISTSICTCCTSLVVRVIKLGAPNWLSSRVLNDNVRSKTAPRTSRPKLIAALAPK